MPPNARRVLLVEDEFLIRLTLSEALADEGYGVLEAEDGASALALLRENPDIALLLTDVQLPGGIDGCALVRLAREAAPGLPAILMSGRADHAAGVSPLDAFIAKPYMPSQVCAAARQLLDLVPVR